LNPENLMISMMKARVDVKEYQLTRKVPQP
jgi:hypothetical protein